MPGVILIQKFLINNCIYYGIASKIYTDDYAPEFQWIRIKAAKNGLLNKKISQGVERSLIKSKNGVEYQLSKD